jgi:hypothetical protein
MNLPQLSFMLVLSVALACGVFAAEVPSAVTPAHQASAGLSPDPLYDAREVRPKSSVADAGPRWIYGHGQLAAWKAEQLVNEGFAIHRKVGYTRNYAKVVQAGSFRHVLPANSPATIELRALGTIEVKLNETVLFTGTCFPEASSIRIPVGHAGGVLRVGVRGTGGVPVALCIAQGPLATTDATWEWSTDGASWSEAEAFLAGRNGEPPHDIQEPIVVLKPTSLDGKIYDFGTELLARPVIRMASGTPSIFPGESKNEALSPTDTQDVDYRMDKRADGAWTYRHFVGMRYLRIEGGTPDQVTVEASFHPSCYRGAFACSDERLTRMWLQAAYTLRLCKERLVLDGIKRDRMPWIGDLASVVIDDAYAFADDEVLRQSFSALGHPVEGTINGITDYTLWWVIGQDLYQRYRDDLPYLRRELPCMNHLLEDMAKRATSDGTLPSFGWVFIDWGVTIDNKRTNTALQILWYWSQQSLARLAEKAGDTAMAQRWQHSSDALKKLLTDKAWNAKAGAWQNQLETPEANSPYPNFLAVLAGLVTETQNQPVQNFLTKTPSQGTPFMKSYELQALNRLGRRDVALDRIRAYWGGMMDLGAVTFWEDFKPGEKNHYAMYNRPFARSLCHAWASGPVRLLPETILGCRPLEDGWRTFTVAPQLGNLTWAKATIPTPHGAIQVDAKNRKTTVIIPSGTTLVVDDRRYVGPTNATIQLP